MTLSMEAGATRSHGIPDAILNVDRARAFGVARRHSQLVKLLRFGLPVLALITLSFYFIPSKITVSVGNFKAGVEDLSLSTKALKMINPRLEGSNDKQGNYVVTAKSALQNLKQSHLITLNFIAANITHTDKGWSKLTADKGFFNTDTEVLELTDNIKVTTKSGMAADLQQATINMKKQLIVSNSPVKVNMLNGRINAQKMSLWTSQRRVLFTGRVRVLIKKQSK